jgi:primase-polymerase (primpol)-like protein
MGESVVEDAAMGWFDGLGYVFDENRTEEAKTNGLETR